MTQAAIRQLITDGIAAALEAQAATMANINRNVISNYKGFMNCQPFYFNGGLAQSIEGNITASKPQTLEEAVNIAQRLKEQIIKRNSVQETNDQPLIINDECLMMEKNNH
ncbi:hypothetical protein Tco_0913003 [Tanacetum coccineum]